MRVKDIRGAEKIVSHGFNDIRNRLVCSGTVRNVMEVTRCAVVVFKRVYCTTVQASSGDLVAGMVAARFSVDVQLICQSVSKNISLQLEEEREVWDSLETGIWAMPCSKCEQYC